MLNEVIIKDSTTPQMHRCTTCGT